ncbi:preprotein translocase subunit SecY [Patescibacteria group bacterium]|nr:preprotein translocase subunit SecY [Patescibacteria group bacterium]
MKWLEKITQIFKIADLRKKIIFVLLIFVVFRIAANIPVPGINTEQLKDFFANNQLFGLLNIFTGGAMSNLSIIMLGLGPYITATIIMQLLTMIFPQIEALYKEEGEAGKQKFNQYSRILTIPLAALQAYAMLTILGRQGILGNLSASQWAISISVITAGALFLMWLGELISEKGVGNGVSLLIFAGIVSRVPLSIRELAAAYDPSKITSYLAFFVLALIITASVVVITEGRRNIPVSYAKRVRGNKVYGGVSTYLPLNVNPAGVIPIIFALSIMLFPGMIASFLGTSDIPAISNAAQAIGRLFQNQWFYGVSYFILVVLFTYFYTAVTFDPKNIAENLQKMGGFVPGIRPGKPTSDFLYFILNRVLLFGAIFLGSVAVLPSIIQGATGITAFEFAIGGTALLIVVSVALETVRQVSSQLTMRDYEGI